MGERRLPADHFRHHRIDQRRIVAQFLVLVRVLVQRQHRGRHGVARGVIAADDQQHDVAHQVVRVHVPRGGIVRHHRDQVVPGLGVDAFVPEFGKIGGALVHFLPALLGGFDDAALRQRGRDVGPARQLAPLLERKIEQGCQHLGCQFDRDLVDPVESFVARQLVEHLGRALPDQHRQLVEVLRREHRRHRLALIGVARLVHGDEARPVISGRHVADPDAAQRDVGGEDAMAGIDVHDVVIAGD